MDCGSGPVVGGTSAGFALAGSGQCGMKRTVREEDGTLPETGGDGLRKSREKSSSCCWWMGWAL